LFRLKHGPISQTVSFLPALFALMAANDDSVRRLAILEMVLEQAHDAASQANAMCDISPDLYSIAGPLLPRFERIRLHNAAAWHHRNDPEMRGFHVREMLILAEEFEQQHHRPQDTDGIPTTYGDSMTRDLGISDTSPTSSTNEAVVDSPAVDVEDPNESRDHVIVIESGVVDKELLEARIQAFQATIESGRDKMMVVYFTGHGFGDDLHFLQQS